MVNPTGSNGRNSKNLYLVLDLVSGRKNEKTVVLTTLFAGVLTYAPLLIACVQEVPEKLRVQSASKQHYAELNSVDSTYKVRTASGNVLYEGSLNTKCSNSIFGTPHLLDKGNFLVLICHNYDIESLSDTAVIVIRPEETKVYPVATFHKGQLPEVECSEVLEVYPTKKYAWLKYIEDHSEAHITLRTFDEQSVIISTDDNEIYIQR